MGSDFCHEDYLGKEALHSGSGHKGAGDYLDLSKIFFSNEEYYSKLEELKKAHLHTMTELETMYRQKLQFKSMEPLDMATLKLGHRWVAFGQEVSDCIMIVIASVLSWSLHCYSA